MEFGLTYGVYGLGAAFGSPWMGNEGTSVSWTDFSHLIKENIQFVIISDFWLRREKLLLNPGESIFCRNISWGFKGYLGQLKGGLKNFFHFWKLWFWGPRSKINEFQISHGRGQFWAVWCDGVNSWVICSSHTKFCSGRSPFIVSRPFWPFFEGHIKVQLVKL